MVTQRDTRIRLDVQGVVDRLREKHGINITIKTWHTYCSRPVGDPRRGPDKDGVFGRSPYWYPATVDAWVKTRPGSGKGGGRPWGKATDGKPIGVDHDYTTTPPRHRADLLDLPVQASGIA